MAKYLIIGPSWVGDMVMAQSLFTQLRTLDKEAVIDVIGPSWSTPILKRMPEVRHSIVLSTTHGEFGLKSRRQLGLKLRSEHYDKAIVLPRSWKSALIPFFAKIPQRIGFHGEQRYLLLNERRKLDKIILNQTVKRFVSLGLDAASAYQSFIPLRPSLLVDHTNQKKLYIQHQLMSDKPAVALMAGAEYGPSKQWPLSHFRDVAITLIDRGYQIWILGGPKDVDDGETIVANLGESAFNLCGKTQLVDAIDLLAAAKFAISNDSGLMHIAAAVGTHVHGIYGSTSELFTPPLTDKKTIHNLHLDCAPCFKRNCPLGHTDCLNKLTPNIIVESLKV